MINVKERLELDKILESIATKAAFSLGKQRVLNSEPSFSSLIVKRDLKRLKDAMDLSIAFGPLSFGGIKDVSASLDRAGKMAVLSVEELVHIGQFLQGTYRLRNQYINLEDSYGALDDLFYSLEDAPKLMQLIDKSFSESFDVLDDASKELKEIRRKKNQMQSQIEHETSKFLNKHKDMITEDVVALRHGRQTFLIKPGDKNKLEGSILGASASGQSLYFEPEFLSRLQNQFNQIIVQEKEEIEKICRVISFEVSKVSDQLLANLETAALLDEIFAKALWGVENDGIVASLTEDSLVLENARHPLIDKDEVVANSYYLQQPHRVILISGPNTGGKSVTLKTIGLFVLLTMTGCPVLSDKAEVMMVDNVFVDIGDQQSIEKSLSSFSAHLDTVSHIINKATSRSLILLDELGSQTDPLEGEALSMAILDHFRSVGSWVVATTHFSKLKKYGTQFDDILNASVEFNLETLKPTYRYQENVLGESNALHIAKEYGIKQDILDKAIEYKKESTYEADNLLEILNKRIKDTEKLENKLKQERDDLASELEQHKNEHQKLLSDIKTEKEDWLQTQEKSFSEKLEALEMKISELDKASTPTKRHALKQEVKALEPQAIIEDIVVGDLVRLKQSSQVGTVERIEKDSAFVNVGTLSMQVKLKNLSKMEKPKPKKKQRRATHRVDRIAPVSLELNIIGKRVAEALPIVDKYLDDCVLRNLNSCHIIHGVGTGQLRNAVHELLRKHKMVKSFELALISEGGAGATRVEFKK